MIESSWYYLQHTSMALVDFHRATGTRKQNQKKPELHGVRDGPVKSTQTHEKARNLLLFQSNARSVRSVRFRPQVRSEKSGDLGLRRASKCRDLYLGLREITIAWAWFDVYYWSYNWSLSINKQVRSKNNGNILSPGTCGCCSCNNKAIQGHEILSTSR